MLNRGKVKQSEDGGGLGNELLVWVGVDWCGFSVLGPNHLGVVPMTQPTLCPVCGCPIQLLASGNKGQTTGTIEDALNRHADVVHPNERPCK